MTGHVIITARVNVQTKENTIVSVFSGWLDKEQILVADGAWGTQLADKGLQAGDVPERWNLDRPHEVQAIAASYFEAGADIVLTNTFGGSIFKLAKAGLADSVVEINRRGVELSRAAASGDGLVFASVGPTGEFMAPLGTVTESEMIACFAAQVTALVNGGADGIVIETMTDLGEALAALRAAQENSDVPVVACLTFDRGPAGFATMMGVDPAQAAEQLEAAGASAVGSNCGTGIENMVEVARLMRSATGLPLWIKPNAGLPELVDGQTVYRETPEQMAEQVPALVSAGARIVGGCCGTTPEHIRLIAKKCRSLGRQD